MNTIFDWQEVKLPIETRLRITSWYCTLNKHFANVAFVTARIVPESQGYIVLCRVAYYAIDVDRNYVADIALLPDGSLELWAN